MSIKVSKEIMYEKLSKDIIKMVGGKENILKLLHCATRLRFTLKDENLADTDNLNETQGVLKVVQSGGQYQIVIGNHVEHVYNQIMNELEIYEEDNNKKEIPVKKSLLATILDIFISVMFPLIGVIAATGILKGVLALSLSLRWVTNDSGTYQILYSLADSVMYFFPIMIGYTAAKKFNLNVFIGMTIGGSLVYPSINVILANEPLYKLFIGTIFESSVYTTFLGIPVILTSYSSTIIPIILACYVSSKIEKFAKKITPEIISSFGIAFITLLVIVPFTFLVIGPITVVLSQAIGQIILLTYNLSPTIVSVLLGGLWIPMVLFGVHGAVVPIAFANYFSMGFDVILPMITGHSFAVAGIVLGITLKTKNIKIKEIGIPAVISAFIVGIIEPALYGILLKSKKLLAITCILSAIGGGVIGYFKVTLYQISGQGIFAIPSFIKANNVGMPVDLIVIVAVMLITFIVATILGYLLFNDNKKSEFTQMYEEVGQNNEKNIF